jgi:hypothetical protein
LLSNSNLYRYSAGVGFFFADYKLQETKKAAVNARAKAAKFKTKKDFRSGGSGDEDDGVACALPQATKGDESLREK